MKVPGTVKVVVEILVLAVLVLVGVNVCDDRCSKNLEGTDLTWEEVAPMIKR